MCTNGSKRSSRVSSTLDFDVPSQRHFFQLSLAVNLQRHRKPMSPFHLTNRSRSATKPVANAYIDSNRNFTQRLLDPCNGCAPASSCLGCYFGVGGANPSTHTAPIYHPLNNEASAVQCIGTAGGEVLGQAAIKKSTRRWPNESCKPPQTRYISVLNHIIQCLFCWAWLEMTCFNKLGK